MPAGVPAQTRAAESNESDFFKELFCESKLRYVLRYEPRYDFDIFLVALSAALAHACYWAEPGQSGVGPHTFATILASMNDLPGPGGTTWDPTVGSLGPVTPWKGLRLVITLSQSG